MNTPSATTAPEIERKFLVQSVPPLDELVPDVIVQGYVLTGESEVRVRLRNERYLQTVKEGKGVARLETEAGIPDELGTALLRVAGERVVEKRRYTFAEGWELDVYDGKLAGLMVVEIELKPEGMSQRMAGILADMALAGMSMPLPPKPEGLVLGAEVTEDKAFKNQNLATLTVADAAALVARIKGVSCPTPKR